MKISSIRLFFYFLVGTNMYSQSWVLPNPLQHMENLEFNNGQYKIGERVWSAYIDPNSENLVYWVQHSMYYSFYPVGLDFETEVIRGKLFSINIRDENMAKTETMYSNELGFMGIKPKWVIDIRDHPSNNDIISIVGQGSDVMGNDWIWRVDTDYDLNILHRDSFQIGQMDSSLIFIAGKLLDNGGYLFRGQNDYDNDPGSYEHVHIYQYDNNGAFLAKSPNLTKHTGVFLNTLKIPTPVLGDKIAFLPYYLLNQDLDTVCTYRSISSKQSAAVLPLDSSTFLSFGVGYDGKWVNGGPEYYNYEYVAAVHEGCSVDTLFRRGFTVPQGYLSSYTWPGYISAAKYDHEHIYFCSTIGYHPDDVDSTDVYVTCIDSSGNINWWLAIGDDGPGYLVYQTLTYPNGDLLIILGVHDYPLNQFMNYQADLAYLRLDKNGNLLSVSAKENHGLKLKQVKIYPSPFNERISVEISPNIVSPSLEMFDLLGNKLMAKNSLPEKIELDVSHLQRGVYFYRVLSEGKIVGTGKLLKH